MFGSSLKLGVILHHVGWYVNLIIPDRVLIHGEAGEIEFIADPAKILMTGM